jgi:hypothetical protein
VNATVPEPSPPNEIPVREGEVQPVPKIPVASNQVVLQGTLRSRDDNRPVAEARVEFLLMHDSEVDSSLGGTLIGEDGGY